jgi:hypothetical protein
MDNTILLIGIGIFASLFFVLRYLCARHSKEYSERIRQILSSDEHKVKGQFDR